MIWFIVRTSNAYIVSLYLKSFCFPSQPLVNTATIYHQRSTSTKVNKMHFVNEENPFSNLLLIHLVVNLNTQGFERFHALCSDTFCRRNYTFSFPFKLGDVERKIHMNALAIYLSNENVAIRNLIIDIFFLSRV